MPWQAVQSLPAHPIWNQFEETVTAPIDSTTDTEPYKYETTDTEHYNYETTDTAHYKETISVVRKARRNGVDAQAWQSFDE